MKRKFLLLALLPLLLAGCNNAGSNNNGNQGQDEGQQQGEGQQGGGQQSGDSGEGSSEEGGGQESGSGEGEGQGGGGQEGGSGQDSGGQEGSQDDGDQDETPETFTVTVNFNNYKFSGSTKEITNTGKDALSPALISYFGKVDEEDLLSSSSTTGYVGLKKYEYKSVDIEEFNALQLASGSQVGSISFQFSKKLVSVKITAQAYFNAFMKTWDLEGGDPYIVYSVDADTTLEVGEEEWTLPGSALEAETGHLVMPAKETKQFDINSYTLSIDDGEDVGRTLIHSLELTFEK